MTLRGIGRNKQRSTSMVLGVVLGMTLILASWGMLDTMLLTLDRQFEEVAIEDATAVLAVPVDDAAVTEVGAVDGFDVAEAVVGLAAIIEGDGESFTTQLERYEIDTEVHGFDPPLTTDGNEIRDLVDEFQAFFYLFVGLMVVFGPAMAFALVFNIISVNVAERSSEFASMRANGLTHRRVAGMIAGETAILAALGIIPGWIVGYVAARAFMGSFSSPEFPITAELWPLSYVVTAIAMFLVAALSLLPALRAVKRIDIGAIVRERST